MENYKSAGLLTIARELKEETITKSGILIPEHERNSIPLRAVVLAPSIKVMKEGILPGDTVLFTTRAEKIVIEFQPRLEETPLLAIPQENIMCYIPASDERRNAAIDELMKHYSEDMKKFLAVFAGSSDGKTENIIKY